MSQLDSLNPTDTHGIPIVNHTLSLDSGILSKFLGGGLADLQISTMKMAGFVGCAVLNIVSSFNWLTPVVELLEKVSDAITDTFGAIGMGAVALAIALMVFATHWLKSTTHRIGYHLGLAVILMLIGVFMVSPVRWAAQAVTMGGGIATEIGQKANHTTQSATISQILATKYVREPMFRANYGVNLDEVPMADGETTCGDVYDSAIRSNVPADEIKDVIGRQCPGGDKLARYAKNPANLNFELMLGTSVLWVLFVFIIIVCVRLMMTGVATVLHGVAVKPALFFVMAGPIAQVYALRNMIAIPLCGLAVAGDLLLLVLGAAFTGFIAVATGSGAIASLITCLSLIGLILGTWRFTRNLRGSNQQLAEQLARSQSPQFGAMRAQEARHAVQRIVTRGASLAATLSGNPAAGTAISALGPGVTSHQPRSMPLLHSRAPYGHATGSPAANGGGHRPSTGGGRPSAPTSGNASPTATAAQLAQQLHHHRPALPAPPAVQIPLVTPPQQQPQGVPVPAARPPVRGGRLPEVPQRPTPDTSAARDAAHTGRAAQPRPEIPTLSANSTQQAGDVVWTTQGARPRLPGLSPQELTSQFKERNAEIADQYAAERAARATDRPNRNQGPIL